MKYNGFTFLLLTLFVSTRRLNAEIVSVPWEGANNVVPVFKRALQYNSGGLNDGRWISDGSPQIIINGPIVTSSGPREPANALWEEGTGVNSGDHYWTYKFLTLTGDASIGLTNLQKFKPGYSLRCLCYGGNLHDGNKLLLQEFGPFIKAGDTIGMLVSYTENARIQVFFDVNGVSYGLAYDISASSLPNAYPVIQFVGNGSATCTKTPPVFLPPPAPPTENSGATGKWELSEIVTAQDAIAAPFIYPSPELPHVTLSIQATPYEVVMYAKVLNNIRFSFLKIDGVWVPQPTSSTLMAGPPGIMAFEKFLIDILSDPSSVSYTGPELNISKGSVMTVWTRYNPLPDKYIGNPFSL